MSFNPFNYDYEWAAIVALIAAAIALYGAWRANKIAEKNLSLAAELEIIKFREQWIQRLRDALAEFQCYAMVPGGKPHEEAKFYELGTKIELLMNRDDPYYDRLHNAMYDMLSNSEGTDLEKFRNNPEFVEVSQKILKREWRKIKSDIDDYRKKNNAKNK